MNYSELDRILANATNDERKLESLKQTTCNGSYATMVTTRGHSGSARFDVIYHVSAKDSGEFMNQAERDGLPVQW